MSSRNSTRSNLTRRPPSQQSGVRRTSGGSASQPPTEMSSMAREPTPVGGSSSIRSTSVPSPMPGRPPGAAGGGSSGMNMSSMVMMGGSSGIMLGGGAGAGASPTALTLSSNDDMIKFRSVSERRVANEILAQEGQWDPENQVYLTRQRQLQERTKKFNQLQQTVRYSPSLSYVEQGDDLEFEYPNAPSVLLKKHKTSHSQLSEVDPRPDNIVRKQKELLKIQQDRKQRGVASLLSGTARCGGFSSQKEAEEAISSLEQELKSTAAKVMRPEGSSVASSYADVQPFRGGGRGGLGDSKLNQGRLDKKRNDDQAATTAGSGTTTGEKLAPLPILEENHSGYSSLLMQLRKTKGQVQQHHKDLSTIRSILNMDGSADLKRTITRMFACSDPKDAKAISEEEYERRERLWEEERKRTIQHQTSLLKEERDVMERELAQLQM